MLEMKRGLFIDIFPCDNVPDKFIAKKIFSLKCFWVRKNSYAPVGAKYESNKIYRLFYKILSHNSLAYIRKLYDALACQCLDENTKRVRIVAWSSKRENEGFPRKWMEDRIEYEFEGHYFWGPQDSDGFLKFIYGNYMKLPPIDQRIPHSPATYVRLLDGTEIKQ